MRRLVGVYTVCSGLSIPILRITRDYNWYYFNYWWGRRFWLFEIWHYMLNLCHSGLIQQAIFFSSSYFSQKTGFEISYKLSPLWTICMKCQIFFFFLVKNSKCGLLIILPSVLSVNNSTPDTLVGERRVRQVLHVVALISRLIVFHPKIWNLSKRCRHMSLYCYHFLNTS